MLDFKPHFIMIKKHIIIFLCIGLLVQCKTEREQITQPGSQYLYEVNNEIIYQSNVEKDKQKSDAQYISILHTNLFDAPVTQQDLQELSEVRRAMGDKQMADELILNNFVNQPDVIIPSNSDMRSDVQRFIDETYIRFFLRLPDAYEVHELKAMIDSDQDLTPELIYQSFALSNEYKFY